MMLTYREVTGLWSARVPDGPDSDAYPDTVLLEGRVTFEPDYRVPLVYPGEHIVVEPLHAVIHEGVLYGETVVGDDVVRGPLFLPVTVDEDANQSWSWVAKFQGMRLGEYGEEVALPSVRFQVPAGDDALDLSEVIPVSQSGNTITLRGPGLSEEDAQALVDAGLDARGLLPDGSLPSVARAEVEQIVTEAVPSVSGVPIFETLAEAQAWETANPGRVALTLEASEPDLSAPTWPVGAAMQVTPGYDRVVIELTQVAVDDRGVASYEVSVNGGSTWATVDLAGKALAVEGLTPETAYPAPRVRALDRAGNVSASLIADGGFETLGVPPIPYMQVAQSLDPTYLTTGEGGKSLGNAGDLVSLINNSTRGPSLGAWGDSCRVSGSGSEFMFGGGAMIDAETWGLSFVLRINDWSLVNSAGVSIASIPHAELMIRRPQDPTPNLTFGGFTLREDIEPIGSGPITGVYGADCDGTTITYYVDGTPIGTAPGAAWPSTGRRGFRGHAVGGSTATADWQGYLLKTAPLGAAAHAELAATAGLE